MKSGSLKPSLKTISSPFTSETVADMRALHDTLVVDHIPEPRVRESFFVNSTDIFSVPYFTVLGFTEGAFFEQGTESNITACRINSIRFANNVTMLAWHSELKYGVDKVLLYTTDLA